MFKIVGVCILLFTIYKIVSAVCSKERTRLHLLSEINRFMHDVRVGMSVSMKPLSHVCRSFETDEQYLESVVKSEFSEFYSGRAEEDVKQRLGNKAA